MTYKNYQTSPTTERTPARRLLGQEEEAYWERYSTGSGNHLPEMGARGVCYQNTLIVLRVGGDPEEDDDEREWEHRRASG